MRKPMMALVVCNAAMKRVAAFAGLLIVLAAPAWPGWDAGVTAFKRGDYATALREWRPLAEQGHAGARHRLGYFYDTGRGVTQDYVEAHMWYDLSGAQGNKQADRNRDTVARRMTPRPNCRGAAAGARVGGKAPGKKEAGQR